MIALNALTEQKVLIGFQMEQLDERLVNGHILNGVDDREKRPQRLLLAGPNCALKQKGEIRLRHLGPRDPRESRDSRFKTIRQSTQSEEE